MTKAAQLEKAKEHCSEDKSLILDPQFSQLVYGKGNAHSQILFIGEAPGEKEALQGIPFVGSAGKQLDKLLQSIGMTLEQCYVANILKYRPPNNRAPRADEMKLHTPYLVEQIHIIQPKVIVTLGNFSTKFVLSGFSVEGMKKIAGVSELHGKIHKIRIGTDDCTVIPLYHPAACLYNPPLRATMIEDFQIIKQFLTL
ncbi:MAG TPA: uracil-DNA glycosylase [Acidobacteriota bacterium]|nr:uracil-DNA glycosylase [Acidobacteriota bacterium]